MRHIYFLLFICSTSSLFAQIAPPCTTPYPPGAVSCPLACVYCDLHGLQGINDGPPSGGNSVCGQISVSNDLWFGFVAGTDSITFNIITSNCQDGNGLQAAIFESCDDPNPLDCAPGMAGGAGQPLVVAHDAFEPGSTYFLMIDGFMSDVCNFEIEVLNGSVTAPSPAQPGIIQTPPVVCPGATMTYSIPPVAGAGYYLWTAPPGALINGGGNTLALPAPGGNTVEIQFNISGGQVCVSVGNACYPPTTTSCRNVVVQPLAPTNLPPIVIPHEDLPFFWDIDPFYTITNPGTYQLQAVLESWLGCDSIVRQQVTVLPPLAGGLVFYDFNGNGVFNPGADTPVAGAVLSNSNAIPATATSDASGQYRFYAPNIMPGDTIRIESLPFAALSVPDFHVYDGQVSFGYDFAVTPPGQANGFVYYDNNENGVYDAGDGPAVGVIVASDSGQFATTDNNGDYEIALPGLPSDTLRVLPPFPGATSAPPFYVHAGGMVTGLDFAITSMLGDEFDLSVDLTNSNVFRPGFVTNLTLTAKNNLYSTTPAAQTRVILPSFIDYVNANPTPDLIQDDTLYWNLGTLGPLETRVTSLRLRVAVGTAANVPVNIPVLITPVDDDEIPANNAYVLQTTTFAAVDPNDKQVSPAFATPGMLDSDRRLEYTIRFQNTGNYPADFVRIVDTLGVLIDPASLRVIASSHPCSWSLEGAGVLEFFFADIFLPDSTSDEPGSHGFVKFSVEALPDLEIGTAVENFCDIYFDFNEPVRTNTAQTQVVYFLPDGGLPPSSPELSARPNPASWWLQFSWADPLPDDGLLWLFSTQGLPAAQADVAAASTGYILDVSYIPNGVYLAVLESGGVVYRKRVVVLHEGDVRRD